MPSNSHISTGDRRLDELFLPDRCGFSYESGTPLHILLVGNPGTGKSTLSAQMAVANARWSPERGARWALYVTLDERPSTVRKRIGSLCPREACSLLSPEKEGDCIVAADLAGLRKRGGIVVRRLHPNLSDGPVIGHGEEGESFSQQDVDHAVTVKRISKAVMRIQEKTAVIQQVASSEAPGLVVVDSINALFEAPSANLSRTALRMLFEGLREVVEHNMILVGESLQTASVEGYLADAVVMLESDTTCGRRHISICKARDHAVRSVRHRMLIDAKGIHVIPQTPIREACDEDDESPENRCRFGLEQLDRSFRLSLQGDLERMKNADSPAGLLRGSLTLLVGPTGTWRTFLAMRFLREGLKEGETCRFVSFVPQDVRLKGLQSVLCVAEGKEAGIDPEVFEVPMLIEEVEHTLLSKVIEVDEPPNRLVITDMRALLAHYGEVEVVGMLERLRTYAGDKKIATLLLFTQNQHERVSEIGGEVARVVDNLISADLVGKRGYGHQATAVTLRKFRGVLVPPRFLELSYNRRICDVEVDERFFEHVVESERGELALGPLRIFYFDGGTEAERALRMYQENMLSGHFPGDEDERPRLETFGRSRDVAEELTIPRSIKFHQPFARRKRSEILMVDQAWTSAVGRRLLALNELMTQDELHQHINLPPRLQSAFETRSGSILAIPYYINFSVLCYRVDLLRESAVEGQASPLVDPSSGLLKKSDLLSWQELLAFASRVAQELSRHGRRVVPFAFSDAYEECFACLLLSMLKSAGGKGRSLASSTGELRDVLRQVCDGSGVPLSVVDGRSGVESVFTWCWYSQLLAARRKYPERSYACVPVVETEHAGVTRLSAGVSLLGAWGFGILEGSLNPPRAMGAVRFLCSRETQKEMSRLGRVVPPSEDLWDPNSFPREEQAILKSAASRLDMLSDYYARFQEISAVGRSLFDPLAEMWRHWKGEYELPNVSSNCGKALDRLRRTLDRQ